MAVFLYKARNAAGEAVEGRMEAPSAELVASQLLGAGMTPVEISPTGEQGEFWTRLRDRLNERKPTLDDLALMARQLHALLRAGVPILRALTGLAETTRNPVLARVLRDVVVEIESGHPLSAALNQHPEVFNSLFVSMVQVGEATGRVDEAFLQLSRYLEKEKELRERIKSALRYPVTVIGFVLVALAILNIYVIPQFARLFANFKTELPLPTRILIATSDFFVHYWPFMALALVSAVVAAVRWVATPAGRRAWDRFKLRIPLVGGIVLRATLARFARAFAVSLRAGVPVVQALGVVALAVDNRWVGEHVAAMRNGVERGDSLTRTANATGLFTPLVLQMLAVGEESGAVDDLLDQVAEFYEREVDYDLRRLAAAIEPIMLVLVGGLVLILALGIFLPMWDLIDAVKGK